MTPIVLGRPLIVLLPVFLLGSLVSEAATSTYTYDKLNRLTTATIDGSRIEYTYDAAGNITRVLTPYAISVSTSGSGTGSVTDDRGKIDCGDDCSGVYDLGAVVELTANPGSGMAFDGWSGACTGTGTCLIAVSGMAAVQAEFRVDTTTPLPNASIGDAFEYEGNAGTRSSSSQSISTPHRQTPRRWTGPHPKAPPPRASISLPRPVRCS